MPKWVIKEKRLSLHRLVADMVVTCASNGGVGLAANQVGELQQVAIVWHPDRPDPIVLLNPEVVESEGERIVSEGCLSIPGYEMKVKRAEPLEPRALWK